MDKHARFRSRKRLVECGGIFAQLPRELQDPKVYLALCEAAHLDPEFVHEELLGMPVSEAVRVAAAAAAPKKKPAKNGHAEVIS